MNEIIFLVEESPEGGYSAEGLGHSIYTDGDTIPELKKNILDAVKCHFDDVHSCPGVIRLHYVKEETLAYA
jgi:hypothetical protein